MKFSRRSKFRANVWDEDNCIIQSWMSKVEDHFRTMYSVSADVIKEATKNLRTYGKFLWVLDLHQQTLTRRSAQLAGCNTDFKVKEKVAFQVPLATSFASQKKKLRSRGEGCKIQGVPPHNLSQNLDGGE